jgi:hypothetical protein
MKKIIFIIPYFGKLPFWMSFFLASCKTNSTINWIIYTDQIYRGDIPNNVQFVHYTFSAYKALVSEKLDINFNPSNPYKLCDIKPALGFVHQGDIAHYDYWGFSDIDLIYGDLRTYFTDEKLAKYQLHSTHATRVAGHLCIVKNSPQMNEAFKRAKNWKTIFEDPAHYAFDEKGFSKIFLKHKNSPKWIQKVAKLFNPWLNYANFMEAFSTPNARIPWLDGSFNFPTEWVWKNGKLTNNFTPTIEYPYFHFYIWKNGWNSSHEQLLENNRLKNEAFIITSAGIKQTDLKSSY